MTQTLTRGFRAALALLVLVFPFSTSAQPIEIKGLYAGMPKAEFAEKFPKLSTKFPAWSEFTIGGVHYKDGYRPTLEWRDDKLVNFTFLFDSSDFETVLAAVKAKYPETTCRLSQVGNAMGATFTQSTCTVKHSESTLVLIRYVNSIDISALGFFSNQAVVDDAKAQAKEAEKDI